MTQRIIALRAVYGRASGLVRISNGMAVFSVRGMNSGRAHVFYADGSCESKRLTRTVSGATAQIDVGKGKIYGVAVTQRGNVVLIGMGSGSLSGVLDRARGADANDTDEAVQTVMASAETQPPRLERQMEVLTEMHERPEEAAEAHEQAKTVEEQSIEEAEENLQTIHEPVEAETEETPQLLAQSAMQTSAPEPGGRSEEEARENASYIARLTLFRRQEEAEEERYKSMSIFANAFPRVYPRVNWQIVEKCDGTRMLRAMFNGRTLIAYPAPPMAAPPVGLPRSARYLTCRSGQGYWVMEERNSI